MSRAGRVVRNGAAGTVAAIAAMASYDHMRHLAATHGQAPAVAAVLPLSVDGLVIVAAASMAEDRAAGRPVRPSAWLAFVVGVVASLGANVAAAPPGLLARVVSAWPAVALLLVVELLARSGRGRTLPRAGKLDTADDTDGTTDDADRADSTPDGPADDLSEPLESVAAAVAVELLGEGQAVTRDALAAGIRRRGRSVSTERAGQLVRTVRT